MGTFRFLLLGALYAFTITLSFAPTNANAEICWDPLSVDDPASDNDTKDKLNDGKKGGNGKKGKNDDGNISIQHSCNYPTPTPPTPTKPGTPSASVINSTSGTYSVSWSASSNMITTGINQWGYELQEYKNGSVNKTIRISPTSTSYTVSSNPSGDYKYRVRGCNMDLNTGITKCSSYSSISSINKVRHKPGQPGKPDNINSTTGNYTVEWSVASGPVTRYQLQERVTGGTWSNVSTSLISTSKYFGGKSNNSQWEYRVRACNEFLWACSAYTSFNTVKVRFKPSTPAKPANINNTTGSYTVSWSEPSGTVGYYFVQERAEGGTWDDVGSVSGASATKLTTTSIPVSGKSNNTNWEYRVKACNNENWACSSYSSVNSVKVRFKPSKPSAPSVPAEVETDNFEISWAEPSGTVTEYDVLEYTNSDDDYELTQDIEATKWKLEDKGDGKYRYRVRACNDFACSAWSSYSSEVIVQQVIGGGQPATGPARYTLAQHGGIPDQNTNSDEVGAIAGEFRVNESGQATYNIPVYTPAGTAGVKPQVSISYSSQGGPGVLGMGWNLSAGSAVTRCRQTDEVDENEKGVTLTYSDRFCLDGQRLILESGDYGKSGSTYRTEIASQTKVIARGVAGSGPDYFEVYRKDGSLSYYGKTDDSQLRANTVNSVDGIWVNTTVLDTVLVWSQSQYIDNPYLAKPNTINYEYDEEESFGEQKLARIKYPPNNEIEFVYGNTFIKGGMGVGGYQRNSKKLSQIIVRDGGSEVRKYDFEYKAREETISDEVGDGPFRDPRITHEVDEYPLRLLSVTESAKTEADSWVSRQPTIFDWEESIAGYTQSSNELDLSFKVIGKSDANKIYEGNFQFGDTNGDGYQDLVVASKSDGQIRFHVARSEGRNASSIGAYTPLTCNLSIGQQGSDGNDFTWGLVDFNGNGRTDLFTTRYVSENKYAVKIYTAYMNGCITSTSIAGDIFTTSHEIARPQDYNGDGLPDLLINTDEHPNSWKLITAQKTGDTVRPLAWSSEKQVSFSNLPALPASNPPYYYYRETFDMKKHKVSDFNGDGRVDLVASRKIEKMTTCNPGEPLTCAELISDIDYAFTSEGDGVFKRLYALSSGVKKDDEGNRIDQFVDINGDGLADYLYKKNSDKYWYFRLSTGKKLLAEEKIIGLGTTAYPNFTDYNHDGRLDIAFTKDSKLHILPGTEVGFAPGSVNTNLNIGSGNAISTFSDVNGDGIQEHIRIKMEGSQHTIRVDRPKHTNDTHRYVVKAIKNGMGNVTNITYKPLLSGDIYTKGVSSLRLNWGANENCSDSDQAALDACSPVFDMNGPMYVVSQATSSSPTKQNPSATAGVSYKYGKARMQAKGRGFLGFEWLETTDNQTNIKTKTTYRQDYPYIGSPEKTVTTYNGNKLSESVNFWQKKYITLSSGNKIVFPFVKKSAEAKWNLNSNGATSFQSETLTETSYDNYGNVTKLINLQSATRQYDEMSGIPDLSTLSGLTKTVTVNTYNDNVSKWQLGRLEQATVTHSRQGQPNVVRTSAFEYDPATGFLLKEIIEPNSSDPSESLVTAYMYDDFGNITLKRTCSVHVSDCLNSTTTDDENPYFINRWKETVYDSSGRYPVRTINAYGQATSEILARNDLGQPTKVRNINGGVTHKGYGAFGHNYFTFSPDGSWSKETKFLCASNCPSVAVYGVKTVNATGGKSFVYYDALGREVQKAGVHFNGQYVVSSTEYNVKGLPVMATEPVIQGTPYSEPTGYSTTTSYDVLGRPEVINNPDGGQTYINYNGRTTTTTNPLQQTKKEYFDASGKVTRVDDAEGGSITYSYTATGELKTLKFNGQLQSQMSYDNMGRKISMLDMDKGGADGKSWTYDYNALGELVLQTDAKGQTIETYRDRLGRTIKRIDRNASGTITGDQRWTYNNSTSASSYGIGQLVEEKDLKTGYQMIPGYDDIGRVIDTQTYIDGELYIASTVYDKYGRVFQSFDAASSEFANAGVRNVYNQYGYLKATYDARVVPGDNNHLRKVISMDARGNVTYEKYGNGVETTRTYYEDTGRIKTIMSNKGSILVQQLEYYWDDLGNLEYRQELDNVTNQLILERFTYDNLNRLEDASHPNETMTLSYDAGGNILSKSGVGSYTYGGTCNGVTAGPHAVTNAGGKSYCYDSNGNMLSGDGRTMVYSTFDKLTKVTKGAHTTEFEYAPSRSRFKRVDTDKDGVITTTHYAGNVEVIKSSNKNFTTYRRNLGGVLLEERTNGSKQIHYLHTGHLGSTDVITDFAGDVKQQFSFNAFGEQRSHIDWKTYLSTPAILLSPASNALTSRGFTGHEQMDEVGLIHMNGRVYDPKLGRFIQADPHIQSPSDTQSLNRYSYVKNNPLSYTDPTGYFFKKLKSFVKKYWKAIVAVVVAYYTFGLVQAWALEGIAASAASGGAFTMQLGTAKIVAGAVAGAASGFMAGGIMTGTLDGAKKGAISGAITAGLMQGVAAVDSNVLAKGLSGGINGYMETKTLDGFVKGFMAGQLSTDLGFTELYNNNQLGNFFINRSRDYIRGYIIGKSNAAKKNLQGGVMNDAVGHLVGLTASTLNDKRTWDGAKFKDGFYHYDMGGNLGAVTIGNVITGPEELVYPISSADRDLISHERDHYRLQNALGPYYLPAQGIGIGLHFMGLPSFFDCNTMNSVTYEDMGIAACY